MFSDGTGSIDVPADWKLTNGGGGSASVIGPTGEIVTYNLTLGVMEPKNAVVVNYLRGLPPQFRQLELQRTAMLAYTGNPESAWTTAFGQLAKQNGKPAPVFHVASERRSVELRPPSRRDHQHRNHSGHCGEERFGSRPIRRVRASNAAQHEGNGRCIPRSSSSPSATSTNTPQRPGPSSEACGSISARSRRRKRQFAHAADAARQSRTDAFLANDAAAQDGMHKQAVAMENFARDQTTVVDATTGAHSTVGSSSASALVTSGSNYHVVPPSESISGVDY